VAAPAASAQRPHLGIRAGYDFQSKNPVVSTQVTVPVTRVFEFYPSMDVYLPDHGTMMGYNGDVKINLPTTTGPQLYLGGGLGIQTRNVNQRSSTDVGGNALLGLETRSGWVHPFVEGRAFVSDRNRFSAMAGLNFTLGGSR
jgi:hypothetical protein